MSIDSDDVMRFFLLMFALMLLWSGFTGRTGDMLAALLAPADLQDLTLAIDPNATGAASGGGAVGGSF